MKRHINHTLLVLTAIAGLAPGCGTNVANNPDSAVLDVVDAFDSEVDLEVDVAPADTTDADAKDTGPLNCLGGKPAKAIEHITVEQIAYECAGASVSGGLAPLADGGWLVTGLADTCCTDIAISRMVKLDADGNVAWYSQNEDSLMLGDPGTRTFNAALTDGFVLSRSSDENSYDYESPSRRFVIWGLHNDQSAWWSIAPESMGNPTYGDFVRKSASDEMWFGLKYATVDGNQPIKLMHIKSDGTITDLHDVTSNGGSLLGSGVDDEGVVYVFQRTEQDETHIVLILDAVRMLYDGTSTAPVELGRWEVPADNGSVSARWTPLFKRDSTATGLVMSVYTGTKTGGSSEITMLCLDSDGTLRWTHQGAWSDGQTSIYGRFIRQPDGRTAVLSSVTVPPDLWVPQYRVIAADGQSDSVPGAAMPDPLGLDARWGILSWFQIDQGELITGFIPDESTGEGKQSFVALYEPGFAALKWVKTYMAPATSMSLQKLAEGWALSVFEPVPWPECGGDRTYPQMSILLFDSVCGE